MSEPCVAPKEILNELFTFTLSRAPSEHGPHRNTGPIGARAPSEHGPHRSTGPIGARAPSEHGPHRSTGPIGARAPSEHGPHRSTGPIGARAPSEHGPHRSTGPIGARASDILPLQTHLSTPMLPCFQWHSQGGYKLVPIKIQRIVYFHFFPTLKPFCKRPDVLWGRGRIP